MLLLGVVMRSATVELTSISEFTCYKQGATAAVTPCYNSESLSDSFVVFVYTVEKFLIQEWH